MKKMISAVIAALAMSTSLFAQPLSAGDVVTVDSSRSVSKVDTSAFGSEINMTWNAQERKELRVERQGTQVQMFSQDGYTVLDAKTFAYLAGLGTSILQPHTVNSSLSGELKDGAKWEMTHITTGTPVSWCPSTLETKVSSKFTTGKAVTMKVTVDGVEKELMVYPVYEHGYWNRCLTGKIVRKFMYSPELEAPLSVEVAMYSSNGRDVNNSHMMRVTEVRRKAK